MMSHPIIDFGRQLGNGPTILFYHGVMPEEFCSPVRGGHHSIPEFQRQIRYLTRFKRVISLSEFCERSNSGERLSSREVVLTFDDGYRNNLLYAAPILEQYGVVATLFVSARHIETGRRLPNYFVRQAIWNTDQKQVKIEACNQVYDVSSPEQRRISLSRLMRLMKTVDISSVDRIVREVRDWLSESRWDELEAANQDEELLQWSEVRQLSRSGWGIGSHCHDHAILHSNQSRNQIRYQLQASRKMITDRIEECRFFAYPNGERGFIAPAAVEEVKKAGYELGLSAEAGDIHGRLNRYLLPRRLAPRKMHRFLQTLHNSMFYRNRYAKWANGIAQDVVD